MANPSSTALLEVNLALERQGLELKCSIDEKKVVVWAPTNPRHPRSWSPWRKAWDLTIIIILESYTTAVGTSGAAAAKYAQEAYGVDRILSLFIYISTYLIAQCIGSVIFPPFSECYGRKWLYITTTALYSGFCALIASVPSPASGAVGRLVTGFLSAVPSSVISGSVEDMFNTKQRTWLTLPWTAMATFGTAMGPIISAYVTAAFGWQWIFYIAAIVTGILTILLLTIRESRPTLLLTREVQQLRSTTGNRSFHALNPDKVPDIRTFARNFAFRPLQLLVKEPIVIGVSIVCGFSSALMYLFTDILPPVYDSFGLSPTESSLPFLALAFGFLPSIGTRHLEMRKAARRKQRGEPTLPEHKLTGFVIAAPVFMIGLWWFAWTIPPHVHLHFSVSIVPLFLIGYAIIEFASVLVGYLSESYGSYTASGYAALNIVRCALAASFPLFSGRMFKALGPNGAVCLLAGLAILFCIMVPMLRIYGERLRKASKFATYCKDLNDDSVTENM